MKFSEKWLREWVDPKLDTAGLTELLTMAGLEVDGVVPAAPGFSSVVVGTIVSAEPHPDADKLQVCQVDTGEGEARQIVCGAANARAGLRVAVALPGARLPDGMKIRDARLRGVASSGMICSAVELGLADSDEGILELSADAPVGEDLRSWLALDDSVIEIDLTPNRGDCLGVLGVAREVSALADCPLQMPEPPKVAAVIDETREVVIEASSACPHYAGRVIRDLDPAAQTPVWMAERLRRSGVRSMGPLVDVTNYVMLELGQPMHAFDLEQLKGPLRVRLAGKEEALELLDGESVSPATDTLMIADDSGPLALAGIMGGAASAVTPGETTSVFLESALFTPAAVAGQARRYGRHTDSSHRFERGVDPQLQVHAIERATELLLAIAGGQPGPVISAGEPPAAAEPIRLRPQRVRRLLGFEVPAKDIQEGLQRLHMQCEARDDALLVTPPSFRYDIGLEADLIEEVARLHGYNNLPAAQTSGLLQVLPQSESRTSHGRLREVLVQRGYQEAITYSFVEAGLQAQLDQSSGAVDLLNPLSAELGQMRTSIWPGLLRALQHNLNRQQPRVRLFELGRVFRRDRGDLHQPQVIAGLAWGACEPEQWGRPATPVDFYDVKADIEALFELAGTADELVWEPAEHPALHPGQGARIRLAEGVDGLVGLMHPALTAELDLAQSPVLFELPLAMLEHSRIPAFTPISRYPSVRRDLALVVDESVSGDALCRCVREQAGEFMAGVDVFDVYRGKGIESGRKSIALSLILQHYSRTLEDRDVEEVITRVVRALREQHNATVRE